MNGPERVTDKEIFRVTAAVDEKGVRVLMNERVRLERKQVMHGGPYLANSDARSRNALNSSALPEGSRKNMVACSPTSPLKRIWGSMMKR